MGVYVHLYPCVLCMWLSIDSVYEWCAYVAVCVYACVCVCVSVCVKNSYFMLYYKPIVKVFSQG